MTNEKKVETTEKETNTKTENDKKGTFTVELKRLHKCAKALNESGLFAEKIKIVPRKKKDLLEDILDAVKVACDNGVKESLPPEALEFYVEVLEAVNSGKTVTDKKPEKEKKEVESFSPEKVLESINDFKLNKVDDDFGMLDNKGIKKAFGMGMKTAGEINDLWCTAYICLFSEKTEMKPQEMSKLMKARGLYPPKAAKIQEIVNKNKLMIPERFVA